ncbi:essential myosin light chain [Cavenderia fasciculata]|uniref:Essential myosin light chain n=1 Tax=Cavenderia fasciculata TaxID=261658 RepID=F4PMX5_CACFS|nr:essential myosin light chain [Cavenderia fasciculata]EGG22868.1 essential myosin light chain [Cavenderia fasciculata]|eukprot:XP_004360719.1 essential myosin light chain [Cavenderia fasciculata]
MVLSQQQQQLSASNDQIQECFSIFDKDNDGKVAIEELGSCLRSLGKNPTNAELEAIKTELNAASFDFATLKSVYTTKKIKSPSEQVKEMNDAFKALDKDGNGTIGDAELRQLLTTLGDYLTTAEVEEVMKEVETNSDGTVNFQSFIEMIANGYPLSSF